jgi:2-polyprenyl-3-methyl-5-hydroxy-6-metoxy-1,4-benzoquinol methylase
MRLDVAHEHWKSDTTRTNDKSRLDVVVTMDVGWHVGTPQAFTSNP